jgi:hypothetical protein
MSEAINEIATALAKAQSKIGAPPRNREVTVKTKTGGSYKFKYATLDSIIEHVRKPLTENGLWFTQTLANGDGKYRLVTQLIHSSGQRIVSETPILADSSDNQAFGSALTYMKRYALSALLGIAADEDDDANEADGNHVTEARERTKPRAVQEAPKIALPADIQERAKAISVALKQAKTQAEADRILKLNEKDLEKIEEASTEAIDLIRSYAMKGIAA